MSYPINYPTPQGANIQIFNGSDGTTANHTNTKTWVKPQGASFVFFTLIGAGGGGGGGDTAVGGGGGGGSGAVINFMCPAFLIPDELQVRIGRGGAGGAISTVGGNATDTYLYYQQKTGGGYNLLQAGPGAGGGDGLSGGAGGGGSAAATNNNFTAMGFFNSVAGQAGANSNASSDASATTFLSGGAGGMVNATPRTTTGNYGYSVTGNTSSFPGTPTGSGFFQMQPIIVGLGGAANRTTSAVQFQLAGGSGGSGCGGAGGSVDVTNPTQGTGGKGGDGMVVIITW